MNPLVTSFVGAIVGLSVGEEDGRLDGIPEGVDVTILGIVDITLATALPPHAS